MNRLADIHSWGISILRLGRGLGVRGRAGQEPARPLELYEFEACPFCRKVRETLSELDLDYVCHPCAKGSNNRERARALGGKVMFPLLRDLNRERTLYESEEIISDLWAEYGGGRPRLQRLLAPVDTLGSSLASALRRRGGRVRPGCGERIQPPQRLELWNFEASPYCRKVREALAELNLDHLVHNVAKRSAHRPRLIALGGKMQVPYLVDPNQGVALYESDEIVAYLARTYAP